MLLDFVVDLVATHTMLEDVTFDEHDGIDVADFRSNNGVVGVRTNTNIGYGVGARLIGDSVGASLTVVDLRFHNTNIRGGVGAVASVQALQLQMPIRWYLTSVPTRNVRNRRLIGIAGRSDLLGSRTLPGAIAGTPATLATTRFYSRQRVFLAKQ